MGTGAGRYLALAAWLVACGGAQAIDGAGAGGAGQGGATGGATGGGTGGNKSGGSGGGGGSTGGIGGIAVGGAGGAPDGDVCRPGGPCAELAEAYIKAVAEAKRCEPASRTACIHAVPSALVCGCTTYVNVVDRLDELRKQWDASCKACAANVACAPCPEPLGKGRCEGVATTQQGDIVAPPAGICVDPGVAIPL